MKKFTESDYRTVSSMTFASAEAEHSFKNCAIINNDGYGASIISFAQDWARLMEAEMANGRTLDQALIRECERLADTQGNSGTSYAIARGLLIVHWKYGKELMNEGDERYYGANPHQRKYYISDWDVMKHFLRQAFVSFRGAMSD